MFCVSLISIFYLTLINRTAINLIIKWHDFLNSSKKYIYNKIRDNIWHRECALFHKRIYFPLWSCVSTSYEHARHDPSADERILFLPRKIRIIEARLTFATLTLLHRSDVYHAWTHERRLCLIRSMRDRNRTDFPLIGSWGDIEMPSLSPYMQFKPVLWQHIVE